MSAEQDSLFIHQPGDSVLELAQQNRAADMVTEGLLDEAAGAFGEAIRAMELEISEEQLLAGVKKYFDKVREAQGSIRNQAAAGYQRMFDQVARVAGLSYEPHSNRVNAYLQSRSGIEPQEEQQEIIAEPAVEEVAAMTVTEPVTDESIEESEFFVAVVPKAFVTDDETDEVSVDDLEEPSTAPILELDDSDAAVAKLQALLSSQHDDASSVEDEVPVEVLPPDDSEAEQATVDSESAADADVEVFTEDDDATSNVIDETTEAAEPDIETQEDSISSDPEPIRAVYQKGEGPRMTTEQRTWFSNLLGSNHPLIYNMSHAQAAHLARAFSCVYEELPISRADRPRNASIIRKILAENISKQQIVTEGEIPSESAIMQMLRASALSIRARLNVVEMNAIITAAFPGYVFDSRYDLPSAFYDAKNKRYKTVLDSRTIYKEVEDGIRLFQQRFMQLAQSAVTDTVVVIPVEAPPQKTDLNEPSPAASAVEPEVVLPDLRAALTGSPEIKLFEQSKTIAEATEKLIVELGVENSKAAYVRMLFNPDLAAAPEVPQTVFTDLVQPVVSEIAYSPELSAGMDGVDFAIAYLLAALHYDENTQSLVQGMPRSVNQIVAIARQYNLVQSNKLSDAHAAIASVIDKLTARASAARSLIIEQS